MAGVLSKLRAASASRPRGTYERTGMPSQFCSSTSKSPATTDIRYGEWLLTCDQCQVTVLSSFSRLLISEPFDSTIKFAGATVTISLVRRSLGESKQGNQTRASSGSLCVQTIFG